MRHSCEHILTMAMMRLFPGVMMAMGPATDDGFYFDFACDGKITQDDFAAIEKEMKKIVKQALPFTCEEISIAEARKVFEGNPYKQEWLDEIEERGEKATIYRTGDEFVDLCAGPHVANTKEVGPFKLLSVAGAYWRGDEKNTMLTRVYGTCFPTQQELDAYVTRMEEAKKRDHRKLGQELDLFTFSDLVGAGLPLWTPKGTILRTLLDDYVWQLRQEKGYKKVAIPHITKKDLYETSGHWSKFKDELFHIHTREGHDFAMKPMNCPHHTQIFASRPRSYRDLPHRYAETTMVYRDEQTGELHGLSRVRCITQDDAHVFCREAQLKEEVFAIWDIIEAFYKATGFPQLDVRLSLHDPDAFDNYLGTKEAWLHAEDQLRSFARERGVSCTEAPGEAAFYGPKVDFISQDSIGRKWQVATIQVDRNMPGRFDLVCTNEEGKEEQVVMVHAAIMGAIERFMSVLIEHFAGAFPLWLTPVQMKVIPITDNHHDYAHEVHQALVAADIRSEIDTRSEKLNKKIRDAQLEKVYSMIIVGDKEQESQTISVRDRQGKTAQGVDLSSFISDVTQRIQDKT